MRSLFLVFLAILAFESKAQELQKVVKYQDYKSIREEYYVLKANTKIKHGKYSRIETASNKPLKTGYFKNNLKDSIWIEYYPGTNYIMNEGYYLNDKKNSIWRECTFANNSIFLSDKGAYLEDKRVGPWQFFNQKGEIIKVFDYSRDTLLYEKPKPDPLEFDILTEKGFVKAKLDKAPKIIGDEKEYFKKIAQELRYPNAAASAGIEGLVVISCLIDENGNESDYQIAQSVGGGLDEEALRVTKLFPRKWEPGILNGKPIKAKGFIPLRFSIK